MVLSSSLDSLYKYNYTFPGLVQQFQNMGIKFETYQQAGLPQDQYYPRSKNFGPRAGFAYKAFSGKSSFVVRGGYSVGYFNGDLYEWQDNVRSNFPLAATFSYDLNNAAQSPDGVGNYWLRSAPQVINGVNSAGVLSLAAASGITPGCCGIFFFNPQQPDARTHSWNLTLEKEVMNNTVARIRYLGNHTGNLFQQYSINDAIPSYVWYKTKGTPLPTGATSNIARRLYDSTSGYGGLTTYMLTGWNNNQGLELEMERRFAKGLAFHISYDLLNAFASTSCNSGCAIGTAVLRDPGYYLPGAVPTDYDARNRYLNYQRATDVPKHRLKWNFLIDLPVGKGQEASGKRKQACSISSSAAGNSPAAGHCAAHGLRCPPAIGISPASRCTTMGTSTRFRTAPAAFACRATCGGTAIFRRTRSTATMPTATRTGIWASRRTTSRR